VVVGSTFGYLIGGYVVRHHSSQDQGRANYTVLPVFDRRQHVYSMTVSFTPSSEQMKEMVREFTRLHSIFSGQRNGFIGKER
jgi:hypothetical protein